MISSIKQSLTKSLKVLAALGLCFACKSGGGSSRTPSVGSGDGSVAAGSGGGDVGNSLWHWQRMPLPEPASPMPRDDLSPLPVPGGPLVVWDFPDGKAVDNASQASLFSAASGTWTSLTNGQLANTPSATTAGAVVMAGDRVIVWGGMGAGARLTNWGGVYGISSKSWRATSRNNAPSPRRSPDAWWSGEQLIVYGGTADDGSLLFDGASYTPADDAWIRISAAPLGQLAPSTTVVEQHSFYVQGSLIVLALLEQGTELSWAGYALTAPNQWGPLSLSGAPAAQRQAVMIATASGIFVWGGSEAATGGFYDAAAKQWVAIAAGGPSGAAGQTAVSTNNADLVAVLPPATTSAERHAYLYDLGLKRWTVTPKPVGAYGGIVAFLNLHLFAAIAWDGGATGALHGILYDQAAGTATVLPSVNAPSSRTKAFTSLDGASLDVWGGSYQGALLSDGAVLNPN